MTDSDHPCARKLGMLNRDVVLNQLNWFWSHPDNSPYAIWKGNSLGSCMAGLTALLLVEQAAHENLAAGQHY